MSDLNALARKLAALGATDEVFDTGARVISQAGSPAPLTAMLRAIDETVLDRKLVFTAGDTCVSIVASGRRMRGLSDITPMHETAKTLLGKTISREDPASLDASFALLSELFETADPLHVRSMPAERFGSGGERGVPAVDLATLWQIDLDEAPLPPLERFLRANEDTITAMLHVDKGDVVASKGDIAALEVIWQTQVQAYLDAEAKLGGQQDGARLVCLDGALDDGGSVALAFAGDAVALLVFPSADLGQLHASWQAAFR